MKKLIFLLSLIMMYLLSSCSAGFDNYKKIAEGELVKIYLNLEQEAFAEIKIGKDSIVEIPINLYDELAVNVPDLKKGLKVHVYQLLDQEKVERCFISTSRMTQQDFDQYRSKLERSNKSIWFQVLFVLFVSVSLACIFVQNEKE